MYYLLDNANRVRQYGKIRRKTRHGGIPTGAIILHSVEGISDLDGPDTSAENTARWMARDATRQASYHTIADRDSIVRMLPFNMEAWHDTTSNNYSIGISVNWRVGDIPRMTEEQRNQYYEQFALAVLEAVEWLKKTRNITVPLDRMLTRAEVVAGKPGISTHGRMDPGRRSDPFGRTQDNQYEREFMDHLRKKAGKQGLPQPATPAPAPTPVPPPAPPAIQEQSWTNPPNGSRAFPRTYAALLVDGDFGKLSYGALQILMHRIGRRNNELWDGLGGRRTWMDVQEWLRTLGHYNAPLRIDGDPGRYTIQGLQRFLQSKGLYAGFLVDGQFGPETKKAFQRYLNDQKQFL